MIQNLGNRIDKMHEKFNKDLEELKSKQAMMNSTINEIKNTLEGQGDVHSQQSKWNQELHPGLVRGVQ